MSRIYATGIEQSDEYGEPTFVDDEKGIDRPTFPVEMALAGMGAKYGEVEKPWHPKGEGYAECLICGEFFDIHDGEFWSPAHVYVPKVCMKCKRVGVYMGSELPVTQINKTYLHPEAEKRWRP